ncbi:hypothetical protein JK358_36645 [Nocardia sp. 2]|uniref:Uncharacterized protein n=1 Tax=Nocardia acididurans TaxID=2802282 RepID=A0ABS1MGZ7_9NOCA|nr:hypothetical protein [Nocardia acididurans]MBL1079940.1 hypothetical protein [Nocardia acididurans]
MPEDCTTVDTAAELTRALGRGVRTVRIVGTVSGLAGLTLPPGAALTGGVLEFDSGGITLTRDNELRDITVHAPVADVAIGNDHTVADFGVLVLHNVITRGQVLLEAADAVRGGHVDIDGLTVAAADTRARQVLSSGYGVRAQQGAITVWNRQDDPSIVLTARLRGLAAGSAAEPVRGSGIMVGALRSDGGGGRMLVSALSTGEIFSDGGIAVGTPDLISGGVFVLGGAQVGTVVNAGPVITYGANDMVLDNWGTVLRWIAQEPVTSFGASGIGFVNFGDIDDLQVRAPIVTHGTGARGFNLYAGSVGEARFADITTYGDGAVGFQVTRKMGRLSISGDLRTHGGRALSLVEGAQTELEAVALSIKPGGGIDAVDIGGELTSEGVGIAAVEIAGALGRLQVAGGISALGAGADAVHVLPGERFDLGDTEVHARHGKPLSYTAIG